jgi:two-component system, NarL family, sensor histidine kinase DegS
MMIEDDGKGFDVQKIRADKRKTGLLNMEERSLSFGGICHIDSNEGSGTTITVELPLEGIE